MKTLTLNELSVFLPFKLMVYDENRMGFKFPPLEMNAQGGTGHEAIYNIIDSQKHPQVVIKPIVRPMSDLLKKKYADILVDYMLDVRGEQFSGKRKNAANWVNFILNESVEDLPYIFFKKLVEMHMDVFDWLKDDLAININELPK